MLMMDNISDRKNAEIQQKKNLSEKETLLKEIHHRVKNNMQIVASLMFLQAQKTENEEALEILQESQDRVKSMGLIHEQLYLSGNYAKVSFQEYLETLVQSFRQSHDTIKDDVTFQLEADGVELPIDSAIPCGLIVNELINNSLKYAFTKNRSGVIVIRFEKNNDTYSLTFRDNGVGLPSNYGQSSSNILGLSLVKTLATQLDASVEFKNNNGLECNLVFKLSHNPTIG